MHRAGRKNMLVNRVYLWLHRYFFIFQKRLKRFLGFLIILVRKFQCDVCSKRFFKRASLSMHLKTHQDSNPVNSSSTINKDQNDQQISTDVQSEAISEVQFEDLSFQCNLCSKTFTSSTRMRMHRNSHFRKLSSRKSKSL